MNKTTVLMTLTLLACGQPAPSRCVTGQTVACACVDGKMGAQACQADGTFGVCQCGTTACNASNCQGCCDASGACATGQTISACGRSANLCVACGGGQSCVQGACTSATGGGGGGGTGGGTGGGGGTACQAGYCELGGGCQQSFEGAAGGRCGNGGACTTCTTSQRCVSGACTPFKRVFATRTQYNGGLGGLAGADAKCALAATAAGLTGTFKAWLSDGTTDALSRITSDGSWFSVSDSSFSNTLTTKRMFNNKANLQTLPLDNYLSWSDETAANFEGEIWTGTDTGGTRRSDTCASWTNGTSGLGGIGRLGGTTSASVWTNYGTAACNISQALLCLEN